MRFVWSVFGVILWLASNTALASEVVLYDLAGCAGERRTLVAGEADLDRLEFGNEAASVRVVAGIWTFYRDDGFQSVNGPPVTLGPSGCVDLGTGPAAAFPPELMDSVAVDQPAPGPGAVIVLYDAPGLAPPYRVLTGNTPDLDSVGFDNRVASVEVLSGRWRLFRDDGFQSGSGPPLELVVGSYPSIEAQGFPADRASSVMRLNVASDPVPPPAREPVTVVCPPGAAGNGVACVDCAGLGQQVSADGGACLCPPGRETVGGRLVDGIPVAICQRGGLTVPPTAPPQNCTGGQVFIGSVETGGGCVPCPQGAEPNEAQTACRCQAGFQQVGIEGTFGFPVCSPVSGGGPQPPATAEYTISGWEAYEVARTRRFSFTSTGFPFDCNIGIPGYGERLTIEYLPVPGGGSCQAVIFGERNLRQPWAFVSLTLGPIPEAADACTPYEFSATRLNPGQSRSLAHRVDVALPPPGLAPIICTVQIGTITLRGPVGADPLDAFR